METYEIGNTAVYYGKGVGLIIEVENEDPRGNPCQICVLQLEKSTARVRTDHPTQSTIRPIMSEIELQNVYDILADHQTPNNQSTWNRRYRQYVQNINSGQPDEIAEVLRDLEFLAIRKALSFGEGKIYTKAKELIVEEGAYTLIQKDLENFKKTLDASEHIFVRLDKIQAFLTENLPQYKEMIEQKIDSLFAEERAKAATEETEKQNTTGKKKSKRSSMDEESESDI